MSVQITESNQGVAGLDSVESGSIEQLRELQLKRLQWSVEHAYNNVAFYKSSFDKAGVHPSC